MTHPAWACSCVYPGPSVEEQFDAVDAVFLGRVIDRIYCADAGGPELCGWFETTFQVARRWKGAVDDVALVRTPTMCGMSAEPGDTFLVYAFLAESDGHLYTGQCTRTTRIRWAQEACALEANGFDPEILDDDITYTCPLFNLPCGVGILPFTIAAGLTTALACCSRRACRRRRNPKRPSSGRRIS